MIRRIGLLFFFTIVALSCSTEPAPKPGADQDSSQTEGREADVEKNLNAPVKQEPLNEAELLDQACSKLVNAKVDDQAVMQSVGVLCANGAATQRLKELVSLAYDGSGALPQVDPAAVRSVGNQTELLASGALHFKKSIAQINALNDKTLSGRVEDKVITLTNQIMGEVPPPSSAYKKCLKIRQTANVKLVVLSARDDMMLGHCSIDLSTQPAFSFNFRTLIKDEPDNSDNLLNTQVNLLVEMGNNTTIAFFVIHIKTDNKGMASVAESMTRSQYTSFLKASFDAIMN